MEPELNIIENMANAKSIFQNLHVGDHLLYTGETTWGKKAEGRHATVITKGYCVVVEIERSEDDEIKSNTTEKATISLGDIISGEKKITPLCF